MNSVDSLNLETENINQENSDAVNLDGNQQENSDGNQVEVLKEIQDYFKSQTQLQESTGTEYQAVVLQKLDTIIENQARVTDADHVMSIYGLIVIPIVVVIFFFYRAINMWIKPFI